MLREKKPTREVNLMGEVCPYPMILLKKEVAGLKPGEMLKALIDSRPTVTDTIPRFCEKNGYDLEVVKVAEERWEVYLLRRG
ncbi:MAG: sulfurtransferase TusA family protein [Candidatus Hydrothermarchaeaceae archaeon]